MDDDFDFFDTPKGPPSGLDDDLAFWDKKSNDHKGNNVDDRKHKNRSTSKQEEKYASSDDDYSSDEFEEDREEYRPKKTIEAKLPKMRPLDQDPSDHSDLSDSGRRAPTPDEASSARGRPHRYSHSSSGSDKQGKGFYDKKAWDEGKGSSQKISKLKPKGSQMGKGYSEKERKRSESYSSDGSYTDTDSETDSDVTDVSPLNSPHTPYFTSKHRVGFKEETFSEVARVSKPPVSPSKGERSSRSRPVSASSSGSKPPSSRVDQLLNANQDSVDMKLLLEAVMEMERERGYDTRSRTSSQRSKPKIFKPLGPAPQPKKNYSFSNDSVRTIDLENQRLMQNILRYAKEAKATKAKAKTKPKGTKAQSTHQRQVPTTSAINRHKDQLRIEAENQALLRRLQGTGATKHVQRDRQLSDYNKTMLFGYSVAAAHETSPKKRSPYENGSAQPHEFSGSRTKSMSSLSKGTFSPSGSGGRSRPQSATVASQRSRPQSAKSAASSSSTIKHPNFRPVMDPRPAWEERW